MNLLETNLVVGAFAKRQGKVRDVYDLGERLLLVATDRISAFDWVLPSGIPDKGRVLTGLSAFWFDLLHVPNHLISTDVERARPDLAADEREALCGPVDGGPEGRVVPFECVVRGYLSGSALEGVSRPGTVCGITLPPGLVESDRIEPIFTPATKAETGHDENVSFDVMAEAVGAEVAETLRSMSLEVYREGRDTRRAARADPGRHQVRVGVRRATGELLLVDEVLTPDSSRYWPHGRVPARRPAAVVRQAVRPRLARDDRLGQGQPAAAAARGRRGQDPRRSTSKRTRRLTGRTFPWK